MQFRRMAMTGLAIATAATTLVAAPASAAVKAKTAAKVIVTTTHAVTAHLVHAGGTTFAVSGWVDQASHGVNKQKVYLVERVDAKHKWVKATNVKVNWRVTGSPKKGVNGYVTFAGVTSLKHAEQYAILHPLQTVGGVVYGASLSKVISVRP